MGVDGEDESDGCTDEDERIIPLDEEVIKRHRLTLNEIRALPRFKEYEPGIPSRVSLSVTVMAIYGYDSSLFSSYHTHNKKYVEFINLL